MSKSSIESKFSSYLPADAAGVTVNGNTVTFEVLPTSVRKLVGDYKKMALPLKLIDASDDRHLVDKCFKIWYVYGVPADNLMIIFYVRVGQDLQFPSVADIHHGAAGYERKIRSFFGLEATGSRDKRSMILHENWPAGVFPLRKDFAWNTRPATAVAMPYAFDFVGGEGVYELPVGPIHAGIIEPGHFRFSLAGESIMNLEARLGYVHKGSEKLFEQLSWANRLKLSEKISGDSSFAHSWAFCMAVEKVAGLEVSVKANYLRTIFAEMERLANHLGDIGFIMLDTGYNFGGASGARLREKMMSLNERFGGNRYLRGLNVFGGVSRDIAKAELVNLENELKALLADFEEVMAIAAECDTLLNRLHSAGPLALSMAADYGALGVAVKAVGISRDVRAEHPYGAYGKLPKRAVALMHSGDVYGRFMVRAQEVRDSVGIIFDALDKMPSGTVNGGQVEPKLAQNSSVVACVEGWRGEIVYMLLTDAKGQLNRLVVRDPSFINWQVVGSCGQGQIVPDFPLINKSFNLSYSGNDL